MSDPTPAATPRLLLVDGSSYLYRAFHAMPDLRADPNDRGSQPTGAIRGMINMLNALRKEYPDAPYAACVFDAPGKTFRDALYPEYKAQRAPMPDDLRSQIAPIHEVVRLLGWTVLAVPGVEADDVIGTLARTAAGQGVEVVISSGDKDLAQLVTPHIVIVDTMTGKRRDVAGVQAEFGVRPDQMLDYQVLLGDAIDNVPGVNKVGPKTAAKWLGEYGSLDAIVAQAGQIKGAAGENLRKALDWLPTARSLLTVKTDCALDDWIDGLPALDSIAINDQKTLGLRDFYEKFGFKGLARALGGDAGASGAGPAPATGRADVQQGANMGLFDDPAPATSAVSAKTYDTILTWEAFDTWLAETMALPAAQRTERLIHWEEAPYARVCHKEEDHLVPLFAALGAAEGEPATMVYHDTDLFGGVTASSYRFG